MYYVIKYYTVALLIYIATFNEEKKLKFWVFKDNIIRIMIEKKLLQRTKTLNVTLFKNMRVIISTFYYICLTFY